MTKMAATEEEDELYENLQDDENKKQLHRYEEITINFGKPVIINNTDKNGVGDHSHPDQDHLEQDIFHNISFTSPIQDVIKTPPIPAPRLSKQKSVVIPNTTSDILDRQDLENRDDDEQYQEIPLRPPEPPPRNVYEVIDEETFENDEDVSNEHSSRGARPKRQCRSDTIDIRNTITTWYDEASEELNNDLSLDLSSLDGDQRFSGEKRFLFLPTGKLCEINSILSPNRNEIECYHVVERFRSHSSRN